MKSSITADGGAAAVTRDEDDAVITENRALLNFGKGRDVKISEKSINFQPKLN